MVDFFLGFIKPAYSNKAIQSVFLVCDVHEEGSLPNFHCYVGQCSMFIVHDQRGSDFIDVCRVSSFFKDTSFLWMT